MNKFNTKPIQVNKLITVRANGQNRSSHDIFMPVCYCVRDRLDLFNPHAIIIRMAH